jgi:hypothetical protein
MFGMEMDMSEVAKPIIQESMKSVAEAHGLKASEIIITLKPVDNEFDFKVEVLKLEKKDGNNVLKHIADMSVKEFINING